MPKCHKIYPNCVWHVPSEWHVLKGVVRCWSYSKSATVLSTVCESSHIYTLWVILYFIKNPHCFLKNYLTSVCFWKRSVIPGIICHRTILHAINCHGEKQRMVMSLVSGFIFYGRVLINWNQCMINDHFGIYIFDNSNYQLSLSYPSCNWMKIF